MTPLDMAACAAVAWAGLATVAAIAVERICKRALSGGTKILREVGAALDVSGARIVQLTAERDAANKRWSRAMHLLRTAEKQNRELVEAQLAGELERLVP